MLLLQIGNLAHTHFGLERKREMAISIGVTFKSVAMTNESKTTFDLTSLSLTFDRSKPVSVSKVVM